MSLREKTVAWARDKQALAAEEEEFDSSSAEEVSVAGKVRNIVIGIILLGCVIALIAMRQSGFDDPIEPSAPTTTVLIDVEPPETVPTTIVIETTIPVAEEAPEPLGTTTTALEEIESNDIAELDSDDKDRGAGLIDSVKEKYAELKEDIEKKREENELNDDGATLDGDPSTSSVDDDKKQGCDRTGSRIVTRCSRSLLSDGRSGGTNLAPGYSSYSTTVTINDLLDDRYDLEYYDIEITDEGIVLVDPTDVMSNILIPFDRLEITEIDNLDPESLG